MAIRIPTLFHTQCRNFTACGQVQTQDQAVLNWMKEMDSDPNVPIVKVKRNGRSLFIRLNVSEGHFHIDVAIPEAFAETPAITSTFDFVKKSVERMNGQKTVLRLDGDYLVPTLALPPIIRSTMVTSKGEGEVQFQMTGGTISVKGSPIYRIVWSKRSDHGALVSLSAKTEAVIDDGYLNDGFSLIDSAFKAFILQEGVENVDK